MGTVTVDERAPFLVGLAQDVIDHVDCEGCKVNAAMGLAALGHLDEFLARTGHPDPRPPEIPFSPPHVEPAPPKPADPSKVYEFRIRVTAPNGLSEDEVKRFLDQLAVDFGGAAVARAASVESIQTGVWRPRPTDSWVRGVPRDEKSGPGTPS